MNIVMKSKKHKAFFCWICRAANLLAYRVFKYLDTAHDDGWIIQQGFDLTSWLDRYARFWERAEWDHGAA